ncbi:BrnT family toxin [Candidatus Parcubacteria bacterium]|nr:BrnT family toxin [Candidatus Parcubacteria bacterium]
MFNLSKLEGFDWDDGNIDKNWEKHKVHWKECEEIFLNIPLLFSSDEIHSQKENRIRVLGKTNDNRKLFLVFTIRDKKIRIISARNQNRKEKEIYDQIKKTI